MKCLQFPDKIKNKILCDLTLCNTFDGSLLSLNNEKCLIYLSLCNLIICESWSEQSVVEEGTLLSHLSNIVDHRGRCSTAM